MIFWVSKTPNPELNLDNDTDNSTTDRPERAPATETDTELSDRRGEGSTIPRVTPGEFEDSFNIRWKQVEAGKIQVGTTKANTPEEAAHIFAPFRKQAQENFLALVTDENGEVINYIHHSKSTLVTLILSARNPELFFLSGLAAVNNRTST